MKTALRNQQKRPTGIQSLHLAEDEGTRTMEKQRGKPPGGNGKGHQCKEDHEKGAKSRLNARESLKFKGG